MKIYSDILTTEDLYQALPEYVGWVDLQMISNPRVRKYGWIVHLEGFSGGRHTRKVNSGHYGAGYHYAATWDDHGEWFAQLFKIDPKARISNYDGVEEFMRETARYIPRGMKASWLADTELINLAEWTNKSF